jgi:hypothetical protein
MIYLLIKYLLKDTVNMKAVESLLISCNLSQRLVKGINKNHSELAMIYFMEILVLKKELLLVNRLISFIYIVVFKVLMLHLPNQLVHTQEICKEEQNTHKNTLLILKITEQVLLHQLLLLILNSVLKL